MCLCLYTIDASESWILCYWSYRWLWVSRCGCWESNGSPRQEQLSHLSNLFLTWLYVICETEITMSGISAWSDSVCWMCSTVHFHSVIKHTNLVHCLALAVPPDTRRKRHLSFWYFRQSNFHPWLCINTMCILKSQLCLSEGCPCKLRVNECCS